MWLVLYPVELTTVIGDAFVRTHAWNTPCIPQVRSIVRHWPGIANCSESVALTLRVRMPPHAEREGYTGANPRGIGQRRTEGLSMPRHYIRLFIMGAAVFGLSPLLFAPAKEPAAAKLAHFTGKVVGLKAVLEKSGVRLDNDAAANWLALVTDDGKVYPLVKDDGARMFFKDARLLDRPMRHANSVEKRE